MIVFQMVENVILDVCNFLKSRSILIPSHNQWLRGSIACFRETNRNYTPNQLKDFVFSQWKLADLKDICAPSLPNNCKTASNLVLSGKHAVQINYAVNIGESFYKQLQKIRRPAAEENLDVDSEKEKGTNEISSNRTLKLEITDGVVTLLGFEDKLVRKLVEPIVPGVKAVLTGPIQCFKGVLFLKNENIDIIGGEVDTLLVPNAIENILARALNQPENSDPYNTLESQQTTENSESQPFDIPEDDAEAFLQIPDDIENITSSNSFRTSSTASDTQITRSSSTITNYKSSNRSFSTFSNTFDEHTSVTSTRTVSQHSANASYNCTEIVNRSLDSSVTEIEDDDEFALIAAETASIAEKTIKSPPISKQTSLQNFYTSNKKSVEKPTKSDSFASQKGESSKKVNNSDLRAELEESYSKYMTVNSNYSSASSHQVKYHNEETKTSKIDSYVTESSAREKLPKEDNHIVRPEDSVFPPKKYPSISIIKGTVESISQKLRISENSWSLSANVNMKGVEIEALFSADALDKIIGITASQLQAKRKEFKQNPQLKEETNEVIRSSQRRIQQLDCNMKVQFKSAIAKPVILEIFD